MSSRIGNIEFECPGEPGSTLVRAMLKVTHFSNDSEQENVYQVFPCTDVSGVTCFTTDIQYIQPPGMMQSRAVLEVLSNSNDQHFFETITRIDDSGNTCWYASDYIGNSATVKSPRWIAASGGFIPPGAVIGGVESGEILYVGRAKHENALLSGKVMPSCGAIFVPWGCFEHRYRNYEVLCLLSTSWVEDSSTPILPNAVQAGHTEHGEPLYVGRALHARNIIPGKVQKSHLACYIPYGGKEHKYDNFEILVVTNKD